MAMRRSRAAPVFADIVSVTATYVLADVLRCTLWMHRSWPEHLPGYGSTHLMHARMLISVVIVWPLILHWLGWHRLSRRPWPRQAARAVAASVVLGLTVAAFSLLFERQLYPRAQIAFVVCLLPLATLATRAVADRAGRRDQAQ